MVLLGYRVGAIAKKTFKETLDDNLLGLSAQTAYYFFFSLFPLLLFLAPLLSLVGNKQETFSLFTKQLQQALPSEGWSLVGNVIADVVFAKNAPGLMSVGALLAVWAGSNVFSALIDALNTAYDVKDDRPWWKKKLIAVASVVVTGLVILVATVLILGGDKLTGWLADRLSLGETARAVFGYAQVPIGLALLVAIAWLSYYFLPCLRQSKRHVLVGAIFTTVAWGIVTFAFRAYVANFADYNKTYGTLGGAIGLMLWFYVSAAAILVGAEINSEILKAAGKKLPMKEPESTELPTAA